MTEYALFHDCQRVTEPADHDATWAEAERRGLVVDDGAGRRLADGWQIKRVAGDDAPRLGGGNE